MNARLEPGIFLQQADGVIEFAAVRHHAAGIHDPLAMRADRPFIHQAMQADIIGRCDQPSCRSHSEAGCAGLVRRRGCRMSG